MLTIKGGFSPGENVELYRPLATPSMTPRAVLETVVADANGAAVFATSPLAGAHYQARGITSNRRVWQIPLPGPPDPATTIPPTWASLTTT